MAPVGKALTSEQWEGSIEPVGVILHRVVEGLVANTGEGGGKAEPRVGSAGVKCNGCRNLEQEI